MNIGLLAIFFGFTSFNNKLSSDVVNVKCRNRTIDEEHPCILGLLQIKFLLTDCWIFSMILNGKSLGNGCDKWVK